VDSTLPLIVSIILNIILLLLSYFMRNVKNRLFAKLQQLQKLIQDFLDAYRDKVITSEEAERLINDIKTLIEDP